MARFKSLTRLRPVGEHILIGGSGEYSDFQYIHEMLTDRKCVWLFVVDNLKATIICMCICLLHILCCIFTRSIEDFCADDEYALTPLAAHQYLSRVMYQRRNKFNPLWNEIVVAGRTNGERCGCFFVCFVFVFVLVWVFGLFVFVVFVSHTQYHTLLRSFLGLVDKVGTSFADDYIATGFGAHLALPLLRAGYRANLTRDEAKTLLERGMRVLFYRDARTINKVSSGLSSCCVVLCCVVWCFCCCCCCFFCCVCLCCVYARYFFFFFFFFFFFRR